MEEQLAELAATVAALEGKANVTNTIFAETYYYLSIPLMIVIHAGFLAYEMGASRHKNVLASGIKNILAFAFMIPTFYFFGWFIYWGFPTGFTGSAGPNGISGFEYAAEIAWPWVEWMGPNLLGLGHRAYSSRRLRHSGNRPGLCCLGDRRSLGLACRWLAGDRLGSA